MQTDPLGLPHTVRAETGPVLPSPSRLAHGKVGEGTLGKQSIVGPQGLDLLQGWCPFAPVCSSAPKQEAPGSTELDPA